MKTLVKAKAIWISFDLGSVIFESIKDIEKQPSGATVTIQGLDISGFWEDVRKLDPNGQPKQNIFGITLAPKTDVAKIKLHEEYSIAF